MTKAVRRIGKHGSRQTFSASAAVETKGRKSRPLTSSAKKAWRKTVIPVFAILFYPHLYALNDVMIQMEPATIVRTIARPRINV